MCGATWSTITSGLKFVAFYSEFVGGEIDVPSVFAVACRMCRAHDPLFGGFVTRGANSSFFF